MAITLPKAVKPFADFVFQVVLGAVGFVIILAAAAIIGLSVKAIEGVGFNPKWFTDTARWGEKILFWMDLFAFGLFLLAETAKLGRTLYVDWRDHVRSK